MTEMAAGSGGGAADPAAPGSAGDPFSSADGQWLLKLDTGEIGSIATILSSLAVQAHGFRDALNRAAGAPQWQGSAFEAMQASIAKTKPVLNNISTNYQTASQAMATYETTVGPLQSQFQNLQSEVGGLQFQVGNLQSTLDSEETTLSDDSTAKTDAVKNGDSKSTLKSMSTTIGNDKSAVSGTTSTISAINSHIQELQVQAWGLISEFQGARSTVVSQVHGAKGPNAPGESFLGWLGHAAMAPVDFIKDAAVGVADSFYDLPGDVEHLVEHPDLKNLGNFLKDSAVVLATLSVGAGGISALVDGGIEEGVADGTADAADEGSTASTLSSVSKNLYDASKYAGYADGSDDILRGKVVDGVIEFIPVPDASNGLGIGEESVRDLENQKGALENYSEALASGKSPSEALSGLTGSQREAMEGMSSVPITAQSAEQQLNETGTALHNATHELNAKGRALNLGQDQTVNDPVKKAVGNAVDPDPSDKSSDKQPAGQAS